MLLETFQKFSDFELLDTGLGYRLERWGDVVLQRPDPQVIWERSLPAEIWDAAWAIFTSGSSDDKGRWDIQKPLPKSWVVEFQGIKFLLKLSPFKHTGLFAEQAANWEWMIKKLSSPSSHKVIKLERSEPDLKDLKLDNLRILNLFGYTGGATMVLAGAGCEVTHVDASKPAITWANENYKLNFSGTRNNAKPDAESRGNVRWILDDAVKFVKRELKRGVRYDGIIMDPPAFGHSPTGKTWKFNRDLPELLNDCVALLSPRAKFLIVNGYATNSSALSLNNVLEDAIKTRAGTIACGELCLQQTNKRLISTGIFARWSA